MRFVGIGKIVSIMVKLEIHREGCQEGKMSIRWGRLEQAGTHKHELEPHAMDWYLCQLWLPLTLVVQLSSSSQSPSFGGKHTHLVQERRRVKEDPGEGEAAAGPNVATWQVSRWVNVSYRMASTWLSPSKFPTRISLGDHPTRNTQKKEFWGM